jgi:MFS family permease
MRIILKSFIGISIGALSMIVPVYHSEIAATKVRGRIITLQQWAITFGIAISFWINYGEYHD